MIRTWRWVWFRLAWPLVLSCCTPLLHVLWPGKPWSMGIPFLLPFVAAFANLKITSAQKPEVEGYSPDFRQAVGTWRALEGLGCFLLLVFELCAAAAWMGGERQAIEMTVGSYAAYAAAMLGARRCLVRAYEIVLKRAITDVAEADDILGKEND